MRESYESKIRDRLHELKDEIDALMDKGEHMEINLQLEYQTLVEELQLKLATANQKFQLLTEASDDTWHEIKADFELIWDSLHELIKSINSP